MPVSLRTVTDLSTGWVWGRRKTEVVPQPQTKRRRMRYCTNAHSPKHQNSVDFFRRSTVCFYFLCSLGRTGEGNGCEKLQGCRAAGLSASSPSASSGALEPQGVLQHSCWLFTECATVAHDSQRRQVFARAPRR